MVKLAHIGAVALLASLAIPARADRHAPAVGLAASPPMIFALIAPLRRRGTPRGGVFTWSRPLFDRRLSQAEKAAALAPELIDAVLRVEPIYDPTRLEGPFTTQRMAIGAGTAAMDNVFADRWRLADPDANIAQTATALAIVWQTKGGLPCEAFTKRRLVGPEEVVATALTGPECALLLATEARGFAQGTPMPIAKAASASVPIFAAPPPGSRMSSEDFWAAQQARVAAIRRKLPGTWPTGGGQAATARNVRHTPARSLARLAPGQGPVAAATDP